MKWADEPVKLEEDEEEKKPNFKNSNLLGSCVPEDRSTRVTSLRMHTVGVRVTRSNFCLFSSRPRPTAPRRKLKPCKFNYSTIFVCVRGNRRTLRLVQTTL